MKEYVTFQEYQGVPNHQRRKVGMAAWVVRHSGGRLTNERQANVLLFFFALVFFMISFFLFRSAFERPSVPPTGFQGNIPDLPVYKDPPRPENLR